MKLDGLITQLYCNNIKYKNNHITTLLYYMQLTHQHKKIYYIL